MSSSERRHVFISYAHRDGGELAMRLQADLEAVGLIVWVDQCRLLGGDVWTREIEIAIDSCDVVLALLSTGSFESDICRAEQERSLDKAKPVIPVRVQRDCDVPLSLQTRQYVDFSDLSIYAKTFQLLLSSISAWRDGDAPPVLRLRYNNAPPVPQNFVPRPEILTSLRGALFQEAPNRDIALTAIRGMGGIGKTVLAQALCHDEVVQQAYPDGIFWFAIGKGSRITFGHRLEGVPELRMLLGAYSDEISCVNQYRNALRDRALLIVLDDVWSSDAIEPFRTQSPRARLLITTRDATIAPTFGAREFIADLPTQGEARDVLARWAGPLPEEADEVIQECGRLPLALALVGAQLRGKPLPYWAIVLERLRRAELANIKANFPEPHNSLFRAIRISVDALGALARQRYLAIAVLLEDMVISPDVLQVLWSVDRNEALETAAQFVALSLAQHDGSLGSIRVHDLQLDYMRMQYPDQEAVELICGGVQLSAEAIEQDANQFSSQVVGRLLPYHDRPAITRFTQDIAAAARKPWLRLLHPALEPPGTALLRTWKGHSAPILSVALSGDGRRLVSASKDTGLKVWDLVTGRLLHILAGHSEHSNCVKVTHDGSLAISASADGRLKVWDLELGTALLTLDGHNGPVYSVAITSDERSAMSASADGTLRLWDMNNGLLKRTLDLDSGPILNVAVTGHGWAVSASQDQTLRVWELESGKALGMLEGDPEPGMQFLMNQRPDDTSLAATEDGKLLFFAARGGNLNVFNLESGELRRNHVMSLSCLGVTPDGRRGVVGSYLNSLSVWDPCRAEMRQTLEEHTALVWSVAMTSDGGRVISGHVDGALKLWAADRESSPRQPRAHSDSVRTVAALPRGEHVISGSRDQTLKVWDFRTGATVASRACFDEVYCVAVTADGGRAIYGSPDRAVRVWQFENDVVYPLGSHAESVWCLAVRSDGKIAISGSDDGTLKVWDIETRSELRTLAGHKGSVRGVAVMPDQRRVLSASKDRTLKTWSLETGYLLNTLEGHTDSVWSVGPLPDCERAVSASGDGTLRLWDLAKGRTIAVLKGHSAAVYAVGIAPNGRLAVSASADKTVKLWNLDLAVTVATFCCDAQVNCCAFASDRHIVAGDRGGRLYMLKIEE